MLAPGGVVGGSVWGESSESDLFTCVSRAVRAIQDGAALPATAPGATTARSNFHLGSDDAALRARFQAAGFCQVLTWHVPCVWPLGAVADADQFAESWLGSSPGFQELLSGMDVDQQTALRREVARMAKNLHDRGKPVQCDVVVITARKP